MAKRPILDKEIALVKRMLERGWGNNQIQFYFNTPARPFNSGRISEIKSGDRGEDVDPVSDVELDEFIENHPLTTISLREVMGNDDAEYPNQYDSASTFHVNDDHRIDLSNDYIDEAELVSDETQLLISELAGNVDGLLQYGDNVLGQLFGDLEKLLSALKGEVSRSSIIRIWLYGNNLRSTLKAHDATTSSDEYHPAKLDLATAEKLRAIIDIFNVLAASVPYLVSLDDPKGVNSEIGDFLANKEDIRNALEDSDEIVTEAAHETLLEQIDNIAETDTENDRNLSINLAGRTTYNFIAKLISKLFMDVTRQVGTEIWEFLKAYKTGTYTAIGIAATIPMLKAGQAYLVAHYPALTAVLASFSQNPTVQFLLDFLIKVFS